MNSSVLIKYETVEKDFFDFLSKNLRDDLLFYAVTGSVSRRDVIFGWSDIDVLIVIKEYSNKSISIIDKALSLNSSGIKIGITFFSYRHFVNEKINKDSKTLYSIDLIDQGICKPKIFNQKIKNNILKVKHQKPFLWYSAASFTGILHGYKHALLPTSNYNEKEVYKKLTTILKIILKQKGIVVHGYDEVFELSKNKLKGFDMNFNSPVYILKNPDISHERHKEYIKMLGWLEKYPKF